MENKIQSRLMFINEVFVATTRLKALTKDIRYARENSFDLEYKCEPICILVTGETGTGKSEYIKKYCANHPRIEEAGRTKILVLVSLLPKVRHPKPVVSQLLRDLGDPLGGTGGDTEELTDRLVTLLKATGVELIIIDEFQHAIETKSNKVVYDISDWIKILITKAKIPVVLFGLPYSSYILDVNPQLARRFSMRHELINYTIDDFEHFQMFLQTVQDQLIAKVSMVFESDLWKTDLAFRLFAASKGNISELMNKLIKPAAMEIIRKEEHCFTNESLINAASRNLGFLDEENPFKIKLENIVTTQQNKSSYWNSHAGRGENCVVDATKKEVRFTDIKFKLKDVF
jgi:hypothetical protein